MACRYFLCERTYRYLKKHLLMCKQILGTQKWALESVWLRLLCSPCVRGPSVDEICRSSCKFSMLEGCVGWAASGTYIHISKEIGPPPQFSIWRNCGGGPISLESICGRIPLGWYFSLWTLMQSKIELSGRQKYKKRLWSCCCCSHSCWTAMPLVGWLPHFPSTPVSALFTSFQPIGYWAR